MRELFLRTEESREGATILERSALDVPERSQKDTFVKLTHLVPLFAFLLPTLVIGDGVVIPSSPIAGANSLTIGFGTTLLGACLAYVAEIRAVIKSPPGT